MIDKSQRIGITETSDPAFHLEIFDKLYDANIIVTKSLTLKLIDKLVEHKEKCILHLTVTGYGGTVLEPFVPPLLASARNLERLLKKGFPVEQVVLRIDPIIPTEKGIKKMCDVVRLFFPYNIPRIRFSILDMYKHVKDRFSEANLPNPYETFHAPLVDRLKVLKTLEELRDKLGGSFTIEACGEPDMEKTPCISQKDVDILGLTEKIILEGSKEQRSHCGCPGNKSQLITGKPHRCSNQCLYCFWKDDK